MTKPAKELVNYDELLKQEVAQIKDTIAAPSANTISTKGKLFTLPDGEQNPGPLSVVILDYISYNSKFPGVYDPNNIVPPECFAVGKKISDLAPSEMSPNKQHKDCTGCPQNQWGSGVGKGKACKNTIRLAVVTPNAKASDQPMMITVSPTGLTPFSNYVSEIARELQAPPIRVTTEISFNSASQYPSLLFGSPVLHDNMEVMMSLRAKAQDMLLREPDVTRAKPTAEAA